MTTAAGLYLDLLKKCLTNWPYGAQEWAPIPLAQVVPPAAVEAWRAQGLAVVRPQPMDPRRRAEGRDWPPTAHTMVGLRRLDHLQHCVEDVLDRGVPGDLIEAGVWRGGAAILMRGVLQAHGVTDRVVWAADSFRGLPAPDPERYPADAGMTLHRIPYLAVSLEQVQAHFAGYGLLDEQVRFLQGWFKDTLPTAPPGPLALVRLDGDLYESTSDALRHLYPRLSVGGYLIVDDYQDIAACRAAVDDYRQAQGITDPITPVDWTAVCWRKGG